MVVPLFLFFFLAIVSIIMVFFAESHIHQSLAEACEETSHICYMEGAVKNQSVFVDEGILNEKFLQYIGEDFYVNKVILGGQSGVSISVSLDENNPKIFLATAGYVVKFSVPIIGSYDMERRITIRQKGFVGYTKGEEEVEEYVYITPNQGVYHSNRACTHLKLSVNSVSSSQVGNYSPCGFCGGRENKTGRIYVAKTSKIYHQNRDCSGLKRTVSRVKKSSVPGLSPCMRCGK